MSKLSKRSIRPDMLKWGRKGEEEFKAFLDENDYSYSWDDTYEYDFLVSGDYDFRVDVKTTVRNTDPRDYYDFNIPAYSIDRKVTDIYVFCHINKKAPSVELIGWIPSKEFLNHPELIYKDSGQTLTYGGTAVTEPLRSLQYKNLYDMEDFGSLL